MKKIVKTIVFIFVAVFAVAAGIYCINQHFMQDKPVNPNQTDDSVQDVPAFEKTKRNYTKLTHHLQ